MDKAFISLKQKLLSWLDTIIQMLPNIAIAVVVILLSFFLSRWFRKLFTRVVGRFSDNTAVNKLLANLLAVVVTIGGIFIALGILNLDKTVTSLLAGAGVVGLAVGLAFQDPILNVLSGVIMSFRKPFRIGDLVETNDFKGIIQKISLRSTVVKELSGEDIIIPNKMVIQNPIKNVTLNNSRRVEINCGVSYDSDLPKVKEIVLGAIRDSVDYDKKKEVSLYFDAFADSSINFRLFFWITPPNEPTYLKAKSQAILAIHQSFNEHNINIPFPIRTLDINEEQINSLIKTKK